MRLQWIDGMFAVSKINSLDKVPFDEAFWFLARTDEELSLVCREERTPEDSEAVEKGWRMFRVAGTLDFALTGIMARLAGILAEAGIPIFAVSTYNTDYILIKSDRAAEAEKMLDAAGCRFEAQWRMGE